MTTRKLDDRVYKIRHDVAAKAVTEDETVILDLRSEQYYALNSTGSRIWTQLERGGSLDDLAADLAAETGQSAAIVESDTLELLDRLLDAGLVHADTAER